jgi:hypothetical protein
LDGTLYKGQKLIDILNMNAGDQKFIGEKNFNSDVRINDYKFLNVNTLPIKHVMELDILQKTKKSRPVYNYNGLATNILMNYTIFKTGEDWEKLLNKVFNKHVKVKNNVYFNRTVKTYYSGTDASGNYIFFADRYDYLRIGKRILDDWNNDTCVGKYLKTIYNQRIDKNAKNYNGDRMGQFDIHTYSKKYGGQFHFDIIGLSERKILGMSGLGGQQVIVDFDTGRIIVVHSLDRHYNWKKIVHKKLK